MRFYLLFTILWLLTGITSAQEKYNVEVPKSIIIIKSTKDYQAALTAAKEASKKIGKPLDLRDNHPNKEIGLSLNPKDAKESGYDFPAYLARGDGAAANDDYISVEYSDAYKGFTKGYYIVVAGITDVKSNVSKTRLSQIKKIYPDAYSKRTYVWFGCMH